MDTNLITPNHCFHLDRHCMPPRVLITYTGSAGPIEGITFRDGKIVEDRDGASVYFDDGIANLYTFKALGERTGRKVTSLSIRVAGKPDLAELVSEARSYLAERVAEKAKPAAGTGNRSGSDRETWVASESRDRDERRHNEEEFDIHGVN